MIKRFFIFVIRFLILTIGAFILIIFLIIDDREKHLGAQQTSESKAGFSVNIGASQTTLIPNDSRSKKIFARSAVESKARELEKAGDLDAAMKLYKEASDPSMLNFDYDAGVAVGGIERIYQKKGEFDLALQELQWHLSRNPSKYEDQRLELEALIKAREERSVQPIYAHIEYLKKKHKKTMPPRSIPWEVVTVSMIRLYNYIGDHDAGIRFMDDFLKYYKKLGPGNPYQPGNPHFQVREGFMKDKAEGFKGCLDSPPGVVCMGHATRALVDSDYFAW